MLKHSAINDRNWPVLINLKAGKGATVINGGGRTLMPGMHDQHMHMSLYVPLNDLKENMTPLHVGAVSILLAERILMNGFTTIRDAEGASNQDASCMILNYVIPYPKHKEKKNEKKRKKNNEETINHNNGAGAYGWCGDRRVAA